MPMNTPVLQEATIFSRFSADFAAVQIHGYKDRTIQKQSTPQTFLHMPLLHPAAHPLILRI
jgi:hypothetical protein